MTICLAYLRRRHHERVTHVFHRMIQFSQDASRYRIGAHIPDAASYCTIIISATEAFEAQAQGRMRRLFYHISSDRRTGPLSGVIAFIIDHMLSPRRTLRPMPLSFIALPFHSIPPPRPSFQHFGHTLTAMLSIHS
jgi:hypothetical protein